MRYWIIGLIVLLAVVGGSWATYQKGWLQRPGPKYLTATVSRGRVESMVNSTGTVKPVRTVSVGAFTSGPIEKVFVDFNSEVTPKQLLAKIDTKLLQAALDRDRAFLDTQRAELARIEAQLQQAHNNEARARKLRSINQDYLSDTEMDQFLFGRLTLQAQRKLALAAIAQAQATLKNSEANLGYAEIVAPEAGIVIERKVDPGQTVAASFQTPELFTIAPRMREAVYVYASVDEADIGMIREAKLNNKKVKFTVDAYPTMEFEGTIFQIRNNSTTTQNVVTYPVVVSTANPDLKLMPGMTANLSFQIDAKDDVLRVPAVALRFQPQAAQVRPEDKHFIEAVTTPVEAGSRRSAKDKANAARNRLNRIVWVQEDKLLRAVPVTLGLMESQFVEVISGDLTEGQAVVTGLESAIR